MSLVYSYVRFSTKKQMEGDSLRRQVELGETWIRENGHTPASLMLQDLGVSSFRGKNRLHDKALGTFLSAIETGRVKPGSILLVENLDRLSRQGVGEAFALFQSILRSGVTIVCLRPYPLTYTSESLNDFVGLLIPLVAFHLAFLESKNKSDRISAVWRQKRKEARDKTGVRIDSFKPAWLARTREGFEENVGADAVRFIFEATASGRGQRAITRDLNSSFRPIGKRPMWTTSYVQTILRDRRVLGERQPYEIHEDGRRIPSGDPIPGYYPAVVDEPLWHRARGVAAQRRKAKGPNTDFVNLFVGLARNAHDGHPMHIMTTRTTKGGVSRRLVSYGHLSGAAGSDPVSVDYPTFEQVVLNHLTQIRAEDLAPQVNQIHEMRAKEQGRRGVVARIAELEAELANSTKGSVKAITAALAALETRKEQLEGDIARLAAETESEALPHTQVAIALLAETKGEELHALRIRLRSLIAEIVEKIVIKPESHGRRVYTLALIAFRSGHRKQVNFGPGFAGGSSTPMADNDLAIDLENTEECRKKRVFTGLAALLNDAEEFAEPETLPGDLRGCADIFLGGLRARLSAESFKTIPAHIGRFVEFIGPETSAGDISTKIWNLWLRHLKLVVAEEQMAKNTARVGYSRSREFVRWLIEKGVVDSIDGLERSGESVLR
jgi:DNA invertase Pin-like site-specific DNA recombinase